jgi:hypothetical protein
LTGLQVNQSCLDLIHPEKKKEKGERGERKRRGERERERGRKKERKGK